MIWFIWSVWFNQTNETDQINKRDQPLLALVARHSALTQPAVPIWAEPATISTVILLEMQIASWAHRVALLAVLLACVVLVDLASYIYLVLGASGANWMSPLSEKMMTSLVGLLRLHSQRNSCLMG